MTRRYVGKAIVYIEYDREEECRSVYRGRVVVPRYEFVIGENGVVRHRPIVWRFEDLRSAVGGPTAPPPSSGYQVASDSAIAFDVMARSAVMFGSSFSAEHPTDPDEATACAISEAIEYDDTVRREK